MRNAAAHATRLKCRKRLKRCARLTLCAPPRQPATPSLQHNRQRRPRKQHKRRRPHKLHRQRRPPRSSAPPGSSNSSLIAMPLPLPRTLPRRRQRHTIRPRAIRLRSVQRLCHSIRSSRSSIQWLPLSTRHRRSNTLPRRPSTRHRSRSIRLQFPSQTLRLSLHPRLTARRRHNRNLPRCAKSTTCSNATSGPPRNQEKTAAALRGWPPTVPTWLLSRFPRLLKTHCKDRAIV